MKTLKYTVLTVIILTVFVMLASAQPLPPTSPAGNAVPIGGGSLIALAFGGIFIFLRKKFKREE